MSGHLVPSILALCLDQMHHVDKGSPSAAIQNLSAAELFFMKLSTAASEQDRQVSIHSDVAKDHRLTSMT